jgi:hypothetical protein
MGAGLYPPPLDLRGPEINNTADGVLFYFIQPGIRNTAMPGWQMPDQDTWRLVVFIRNLPKVVSLSARAPMVPKIQQMIADVNVRSHTFHFVTPATTDALKIPNACNVCPADKSTAWATAALKTWADRSPWRVAE